MTKEEELGCVNTYLNYLRTNQEKYVYVNELKYPYTEKAVKIGFTCWDFGNPKYPWSEQDKGYDVYFWIPRKFAYSACCAGCNCKIPKWLAISNLEKIQTSIKEELNI